ncbi:efflux RND transporter periplasmic adaptor subunit [Burkholderia gladioli]|uniref:efflux RND transporter periplasmic adaptor subunit n=1 Tax=Burkholderia gladioli TaxID=28095 RepID=UPI00164150D8|nr:efflux RND transporter periplasmic adaptor subunit [Burkholderia gladioli]
MTTHSPIPPARRDAWRHRRWLWLPAVLLAAGCGRNEAAGSPDEADAADPPAAVAVAVAHPVRALWPVDVPIQAEVRASREVSVPALLRDAPLTEVDVDVGDSVRAGQPLARLDARAIDNQLAQRRASVAEADANLEASRLTLKRSHDLAATGAISEQDILHYRTQVAIDTARVALANAQLDASRMQQADATIRAPIDGVVSVRTAMPGRVSAPGDELFRIVSRRDCELVASLDAARQSLLAVGADVTIDSEAGPLVARVRAIAPAAGADRFSVAVYLRMTGVCRWPPGTYVAARLRLGTSPAASIERGALFLRDGFEYVMTVGAQGHLHRAKVVTGRTQGTRVEIVSGIADGERVVTSGAGALPEGMVVRVEREDGRAAPEPRR